MLTPSKSSVSRWAVTLAALTTAAVGVDAFAKTFPIVAWADRPHHSLSTLASSSHASSLRSSSSGTQASFSSTSSSSSSDPAADLCSLESILLVSAPGLHYSDLPLLPKTPTGVRARLNHYSESSLTRAYVPMAKGVLTTPERVARTFIQQCDAVVQTNDYASLWQGNSGKALRIETVQGLDEWELVGAQARQGRREVLNKIDEAIQAHLRTLSGPYLVVLTSLPNASIQALDSTPHLTKRQQALDMDDNALDDALIPSSSSSFDQVDAYAGQDRPIIESVAEKAAQAVDAGLTYVTSAFAPNQTSIFEVQPNSGLLHRYVFLTPALILCELRHKVVQRILISTLILIPLLVFTSQALTTVQTVHGLEHKMTGTVGIDSSKGGS
ncbi:BQ2448_3644 [Microbotryum intermedium]|uniref:BQ2448_3644 protein n=1 Tax=Microbotryum intermedium TaxID=269621 RepID=A0A238FAK6_9BASI|nr:BQ2448_3644 [Microbotryum intermedium]